MKTKWKEFTRRMSYKPKKNQILSGFYPM